MGKGRMSMLDLRVQARELNRRLRGSRVANVYDINAKTYLLKLAVPPVREDQLEEGQKVTEDDKSWKKVLLLVESGARIHTTNFVRDKGDVPSGFALKLRKHIRTRRLESVEQIGADRVMRISFSLAGQIAYHLILEFYAGGNIVLTDQDYTIIGLLRVYKGPAAAGPVAVKERYAIEAARTDARVTRKDIEEVISGSSGESTVKKVLSTELQIGPELVEHALFAAGFTTTNVAMSQLKSTPGAPESLLEAIDPFLAVLRNEEVPELQLKGIVVTNEAASNESSNPATYETFSPYTLSQFASKKTIEFSTFDDAVDEFFAKIESQRLANQLKKKENAVIKKVDKVRNQLQGHVVDLEKSQVSNIEKATAIEAHVEDVEAAILVMRGAMASALDWQELDKSIKQERKNGNPVAQIIHSLQLERNTMTLMLEHPDDIEWENDDVDDDSSENSTSISGLEQVTGRRPALLVEVDIFASARANAQQFYTNKKVAATKHNKAVQATDRAIRTAEEKAQKELERVEVNHSSVREVRKRFWFEKFHWFVSSENFMVIAGRDAQQNEILVRRYLKNGDAYVHADIHGASSVIVKNTESNKNRDIPHLTLTQAGCFAMCRSSAWDSKIVTSAWWVRSNQVSKTAPTGEYLSTGSFVIRGKKNFLPPSPLVMGFGLLFRMDESCVANHAGERSIRSQLDVEQEVASDVTDLSTINAREIRVPEDDVYDIITSETSTGQKDTDVVEGGAAPSARTEAELFANLDLRPQEQRKDKYAFEDEVVDEPEGGGQVPATGRDSSSRGNRKYLSAKERKILKKGGEVANTAEKDSALPDTEEKTKYVGGPTVNPVPRGKRGKLKKRQQKYADQDDEERELMLQLIGGAPMKEDIVSKEETGENEETTTPEEQEREDGHHDRKPWMKRDQKREEREIKHVLEDEGVVDLTEAEKKALTSLDMLTGKPTAEDILEFAVPVCAPYAALGAVRMKVKLLPGTLRRGKSFRQAESVFLRSAEKDFPDSPQTTARLKELIRQIPESDALQTIMSSARVEAPGLQEAKRATKKAKAKMKSKV